MSVSEDGIPDEILAAIAERMNRLDELGVRWDRCTTGDGTATAFGWIDRDDGRHDFVALEFQWGDTRDLAGDTVAWLGVGTNTSSALHSRRIAELIYGTSSNHQDCERVDDVFGALVNSRIALEATS